MRKKITLLSFLLVLLVSITVAQSKEKGSTNKFRFGSQNYAGILEGELGTSFQGQTINGLRYKTWFAGIGAGLDYYYDRSIPLFFSLNKFLAGKIPLYFNGDVGVNFPWVRDRMYNEWSPQTDFDAGLFWSGGVGYKFSSKKNDHGFLLNFGYSYKHMIEKTENTFPCFNPPCPVETERYDYRLKRLSVKLGWMF